MAFSLKYAVVERERRFLVRSVPHGVTGISQIRDRYIDASRLRLREVRGHDGRVVRKLGQKIRLGDGPSAIACTSMFLDDEEWSLLSSLPARVVTKRRHHLDRDGVQAVIDELEDGTLLAEIDDGDRPPAPVPSWLDVIADVTGDEAWTGGTLAARTEPPPAR
jgi:CYTH domain-containing protein